MRYHHIGKTDIKISEIGFGAWGIGGLTKNATSYGTTDDKTSIEALNYAHDVGINFFDTSNVYGDGHSEYLIGKTFKNKRDNIVIATKFGLHAFDKPITLDKQHIRASVEGSLKRLQSDYIDILQSHKITRHNLKNYPDILDTLHELKKEGKIRAFGFSTNQPQDCFHILQEHDIDIYQGNLNLLDMRFLEHIPAIMPKKELSFIARTPFAFGFLAENFPMDITFNAHDHRSLWSIEQQQTWIKTANELLCAMGCKNINATEERCAYALNFCLSVPYVKTVIPGIMCKEHVDLNIHACQQTKLNEQELKDILLLYQDIDTKENGIMKK